MSRPGTIRAEAVSSQREGDGPTKMKDQVAQTVTPEISVCSGICSQKYPDKPNEITKATIAIGANKPTLN